MANKVAASKLRQSAVFTKSVTFAPQLATDNRLLATGFQRAFPARTMGAASEDTTTSSSQFGDTVPSMVSASTQVTGARDDQDKKTPTLRLRSRQTPGK
jgi:hypothetical protein